LYGSTIAFQWFATLVVAWRCWARGLTAHDLALTDGLTLRSILATIIGTAAFAGFQWFNLRRVGRMGSPVVGGLRRLAERIFPQNSAERVPYFGLAATAGLCEEFLYRGFAMAALTGAGLPAWLVVILSAAVFGLGHLYQGRGGLVSTL